MGDCNTNGPTGFDILDRIGGMALPDYFVRQRWGLSGLMKGAGRPKIGQFAIQLRNLNESSISDAVATFSRLVSCVIQDKMIGIIHFTSCSSQDRDLRAPGGQRARGGEGGDGARLRREATAVRALQASAKLQIPKMSPCSCLPLLPGFCLAGFTYPFSSPVQG